MQLPLPALQVNVSGSARPRAPSCLHAVQRCKPLRSATPSSSSSRRRQRRLRGAASIGAAWRPQVLRRCAASCCLAGQVGQVGQAGHWGRMGRRGTGGTGHSRHHQLGVALPQKPTPRALPTLQVLLLYRRTLKAAAKFPSIKRGALIDDIKLQFKEHKACCCCMHGKRGADGRICRWQKQAACSTSGAPTPARRPALCLPCWLAGWPAGAGGSRKSEARAGGCAAQLGAAGELCGNGRQKRRPGGVVEGLVRLIHMRLHPACHSWCKLTCCQRVLCEEGGSGGGTHSRGRPAPHLCRQAAARRTALCSICSTNALQQHACHVH